MSFAARKSLLINVSAFIYNVGTIILLYLYTGSY